jgi:hypothetical protein
MQLRCTACDCINLPFYITTVRSAALNSPASPANVTSITAAANDASVATLAPPISLAWDYANACASSANGSALSIALIPSATIAAFAAFTASTMHSLQQGWLLYKKCSKRYHDTMYSQCWFCNSR